MAMFVNDCENNQEVGRIIGIDPGSTTLGVSIIEYDVRTLKILRTCAYTLNASKMRLNELDIENHSDRYARIYELGDALYDLFVAAAPNFIISESPFLSRRMPTTFAVLTEVVFAIRYAVRKYDPTIKLDLVDPPSAKMAVGASGKAKKDQVHAALKKIEAEICFDEANSAFAFNLLDEHSVDAIAIGYYKWKKLLEFFDDWT